MNWNRLYKLRCGIQHYDWGERAVGGSVPYIAHLLGIEPTAPPYAELWMGDHPAMPARLQDLPGEPTLREAIAAHPEQILGERMSGKTPPILPFLMKVLSCQRPLSIQAHPDRDLAAALHQRDPEHYPDANHKPEIAICLTHLQALASFRHRAQIQADIAGRPPLAAFFSGLDSDDDDWLRRAYAQIFQASVAEVQRTVRAMENHLAQRSHLSNHDAVFTVANAHYPDGRGALSVYFLNYMELEPQQALFIPANEPHAYLNGTILECMATSDNVVRAGMTKKFIDADVLLDMLSYDEGSPNLYSGDVVGEGIRRYPVPVPDFEVECRDVRQPMQIESQSSASILLVLDGTAILRTDDWTAETGRGDVWLQPAATDMLQVSPAATSATIVRAYAPAAQ